MRPCQSHQNDNRMRRPLKGWTLLLIVLLPLFVAACGGRLGNIRVEDVDASLADADTAIQSAYQSPAMKYEPGTLRHAEKLFDDAQTAKNDKDGIKTLRLAYSAKSEAQLAENRARQQEFMEKELENVRQEKDSEIRTIQEDLRLAEQETARMTLDVQRLERRLEQLESDKREIAMELAEQQNAEWKVRQAEVQVEALQEQLDDIKSQLRAALRRQRQAELLAQELSNKLSQEVATARSTAEEAQKQVKAAKTKAVVRSQAYTAKIDKLERAKTLERAKAEARKHAATRVTEAIQTGTASMVNFDEVRPIVMDWHNAWKAGRFNDHLLFYTTDATVEKIRIKGDKEYKMQYNRQQIGAEIRREFNPEKWQEFPPHDMTKMPITYQFQRLSQSTTAKRNAKLYDRWLRELWFRKEGATWKISHETWKIYEAVPSFQ